MIYFSAEFYSKSNVCVFISRKKGIRNFDLRFLLVNLKEVSRVDSLMGNVHF